MNYITLINQFWHCNKEHSFTPNETAVYFGILDTCNELLWKNPFNQSNRRLADKCNVSEPTFIKARNSLKQRGLIEFKSEVGRRNNTVYEIKYLKSFSISESISSSISESISDTFSDENRLDNNKQKTKRKKNKTENKGESPFIPPTLDEVKAYFEEKGYQESAAVKAWNFYDANDWKDSNGNKVRSWKQKMIGVWFKPEYLKPTGGPVANNQPGTPVKREMVY